MVKTNAGKLKAIDVFSGCGGLTQGLKMAGFSVIGAIEIDPLSIETYHFNHPEVRIWPRDIRKVTVKNVMQKLKLRKGELDLLAGCPPCQGFSSIRTHNKGIVNDPRNELLFQYLRFVRQLRPKAIMMENTPELADDWRMKVFFRTIVKLGYKGDYPIIDAKFYGVPQRRRRMVLLAGYGNSIEFPSPEKKILTVKDAIGNLYLAGSSGDPLHDFPEKRSQRIIDRIKCIPVNGGSRKDLGDAAQLKCHKKLKGFNDVYGRMAWGKESPTITGGCTNPSKGRFLHPEQDRSITLREAALLQTFPTSYYFSLEKGKSAVAEMIGNALPPEFVKRHGLKIKNYLLKKRQI